MKIIKTVSSDVIIQAWLKAEWDDPAYDPIRSQVPQAIVNNENFNDPQENQIRFKLLHARRQIMLDPLPKDTIWYSASFDIEDFNRTFIVPSNDWEIISEKTYSPFTVVKNLHLDDVHAKKINSIHSSPSVIDRRLILVASDINSVMTIIEGNHRGVSILKDSLEKNLQNTIINELFIGTSPHMRDYLFHIERYMIRQ